MLPGQGPNKCRELKEAYKMKAHIFDLDGTLIDSMGLWENIDKTFFERRGITLPDDYGEYVKKITPLSPMETAAYAIKHFNLSDTPEEVCREWNEMAYEIYSSKLPMKAGAKKYLQTLRAAGAKMAVATSSPKELCIPALRHHGIEGFFDAVCLSEETGFGKTRPDVFLLAAKRLGAAPADCIVYEDSFTAVKTAKGAGMAVYAVYDGASGADWEGIRQIADRTFHDFAELIVNA
jgi:HAD superfamily hydrolase (TIGR01509 family)